MREGLWAISLQPTQPPPLVPSSPGGVYTPRSVEGYTFRLEKSLGLSGDVTRKT
jgi:hypothetical protein